MNKKIILTVTWIIVMSLVFFSVVKNPNSFIVNGTIIVGWLLFAIQLTWNQSERFYMWFKNIWFNLKNPDCMWNMQVEFEGDFERNIFEKLDEVFSTKSENYKITPISNVRKLYKINAITYEVVVSPNQIRVQLQDLEVSFRRSKVIIQKELGGLLENLSRVLKEDKCDYYLSIEFKESNPYFGFFLRRLNAKDISAFNVKFKVDDERITINKKTIEVHTESLQSLRSFSEEYLSLSPRSL